MNKVKIGRVRRARPSETEYTSMIAMPTPTGWGEDQKAAHEGCLRLDSGEIRFERIPVRLFPDRPMMPEPREDNVIGRLGEDTGRPILPVREESPGYDMARVRRSHGEIPEYESMGDSDVIRDSFLEQMRMLDFRIVTGAIIALFLASLEVLPGLGVTLPDMFLPDRAPVIYLVLNIIMAGFHIFLCRNVVIGGLSSLFRKGGGFRPDGEAILSMASAATMLQMIAELISCMIDRAPVHRVCAAPVVLALLINDIGLLAMTRRAARNFGFVAMRGIRRSAELLDGDDMTGHIRHVGGQGNPCTAYGLRTKFSSGYMHYAYKEDFMEQMTGKLTPYVIYIALGAAVLGGLIGWHSYGIWGAVYCLCITLTAGVPVCRLLCLNLPMEKAAKKLLRRGAMLNGWAGVEKFGSVNTLAVDADVIFPDGTVELLSTKAFKEAPIDRSVLYAASLVIAAGGPLAQIFRNTLRLTSGDLLPVEGIEFEHEMGIAGYVEHLPVLVGNRDILRRHGCAMPSQDYESIIRKGQNRYIVYIAISGIPCAAMLVEYSADRETTEAMRNMAESGVNLVVYTCDANVTSRLISDIYHIPAKIVTVLNVRQGSQFNELTHVIKDERPAILVTNGELSALAHGITTARKLRQQLTFATIVQMVCYVLELMLVTVLCVTSGSGGISPARVLLLQIICLAAALCTTITTSHGEMNS